MRGNYGGKSLLLLTIRKTWEFGIILGYYQENYILSENLKNFIHMHWIFEENAPQIKRNSKTLGEFEILSPFSLLDNLLPFD